MQPWLVWPSRCRAHLSQSGRQARHSREVSVVSLRGALEPRPEVAAWIWAYGIWGCGGAPDWIAVECEWHGYQMEWIPRGQRYWNFIYTSCLRSPGRFRIGYGSYGTRGQNVGKLGQPCRTIWGIIPPHARFPPRFPCHWQTVDQEEALWSRSSLLGNLELCSDKKDHHCTISPCSYYRPRRFVCGGASGGLPPLDAPLQLPASSRLGET